MYRPLRPALFCGDLAPWAACVPKDRNSPRIDADFGASEPLALIAHIRHAGCYLAGLTESLKANQNSQVYCSIRANKRQRSARCQDKAAGVPAALSAPAACTAPVSSAPAARSARSAFCSAPLIGFRLSLGEVSRSPGRLPFSSRSRRYSPSRRRLHGPKG